jgi:hypothetical protein
VKRIVDSGGRLHFRRSPVSRASVESLERRKLFTAVVLQPIPNQTFAQDSGAEQAYLYGVFTDTNGLQDLTFSATSTNPAVLTASVSGSTLNITPVAGQSGIARVQMVATDPFGTRVSNTFRVQITAADARALDVQLGGGSPTSIRYTQSNGTSATVSLSGPGMAVLHFGGDNLARAGTVLNGSNKELESIALNDTTTATILNVSGQKAAGLVASVGNITATGSLGRLDIKNAVLDGDVNITGSLPVIDVDFAEGGTFTIGSGSVSIAGKSFVDENLASSSPVSFVKLLQWTNSDNVPESFTAAFVRSISVKGNFTPGLQLSGSGAPGRTLGSAKIPGAIGGTWNITGASAPLTVGGTQPDFDGTFGGLPSFTSRSDFQGNLTAPTVRSFNVRGNIAKATINLTAAGVTDIQSLSAKQIFLSSIFTAGDIGTLSVGVLETSTIYAGVVQIPTSTLPASVSDFAAQASIRSIVVRGGVFKNSFTACDVAAWSLGNLQLNTVQGDNGGIPFGIVGHTISALQLKIGGKELNLKGVKDQATLDAQVAASKVKLADMTLEVF